jgi:2-aminoadipate transaminase
VETISFARGVPAPECIPVEELADCARAAVERDAAVLSYGEASGYRPLREWIAARHGVTPAEVLVTNGGLQGFSFLARHLCRPGSRVLVELPTYDRPLRVLEQLAALIEALPMDEEGLEPAALAEALARGPKPAFLYTIPTFQNPSGRTLSAERRRQIVELAREHDLLVLEDDPYGLVRFEGETPPTLFELDGGDRVLYASSFSKTVAPGARVGYFVLPAALLAELESSIASTYISPALIGQATVYEFLRRERFEPNLERVRALLRSRRDAMLEALDRGLASADARWSRPAGGYFVWLEVAGVDARELLDAAKAEGVVFVPGADFGGPPGSARLAYSFVSPDEIAVGVERLARLVSAPAPV